MDKPRKTSDPGQTTRLRACRVEREGQHVGSECEIKVAEEASLMASTSGKGDSSNYKTVVHEKLRLKRRAVPVISLCHFDMIIFHSCGAYLQRMSATTDCDQAAVR